MTTHFAASKPQRDIGDLLRRDPFLRQIHRAKTVADLTAIIQGLGITDAQHRAAMLGLAKMAWLLLRQLE